MRTRLAPLAIAVAILALAVRVLTPQGFMIAAPAEPGATPVVICSGGAGGPVDPGSGRDRAPARGHDCAFAMAGALIGAPPPPPSPQPSRAHPAEPARPFEARSVILGLLAPPPPQTGPPLRA